MKAAYVTNELGILVISSLTESFLGGIFLLLALQVLPLLMVIPLTVQF